MALGAQSGELKRMFVRNGLLWVSIGAVAGMGVAAGVSRLLTSLLFEVSPVDPLTYGLVAAGMLMAGAAASYLPAR